MCKYLIYQQSVKLEEFCNKNILNTVHEDKIILQFIQFIPFVIKYDFPHVQDETLLIRSIFLKH